MQERVKFYLRLPLYFALFVLLGLVFGFLTLKILSYSRTVSVPALINLSVIEANDVLADTGLHLKVEGEDYDPSVPVGKIIRQDVPPGSKVKEKRSIRVYISRGPKVFALPLLVNMQLADAESVLHQQGLRVGRTIWVHSDNFAKNVVITQKPAPDDKPADVVTVLVSLGPHAVTYSCPDFFGMNLQEAVNLADRLHLNVDLRGVGATVISQIPQPGALVNSGDTIVLGTGQENVHG